MFHEVWKALSPEFRAEFLKRCIAWWLESEHGELAAAAHLVSKVSHSRLPTVLAQFRKGDIAGLRIAVGRHPERMADLMGSTVFSVHPPEMAEIHGLLETERSPETGQPVEGYAMKAPALENMRKLLAPGRPAAIEHFGPLVAGILAAAGSPAWAPVARQALVEASAALPAAEDADRPGPSMPASELKGPVATESPAGTEPSVREPEPPEPPAPAVRRTVSRPSELDRILIDAAVQAANGSVGARSLESIAAVAEEFARLNDRRFPSQALLGFVDALQGRELRPMSAGGNVPRRIWYLKGFLEGHRRTDTDAAFAARIKALSPADLAAFETAAREFGLDTLDARLSVAGMAIQAAISVDDPELAQQWSMFANEFPPIEPMLDWALARIRSGDPRRPLPLLKHLRTQIRGSGELRVLPEGHEIRERAMMIVRTVLGLEATALRLGRRYDDACNRLERLREIVGEADFGPELAGALALAKLRIAKIEDVPLHGADLDSILKRLKTVDALLQRADRDRGYAPALFLLALPTVFSSRPNRAERDLALERLHRAAEWMNQLEIDLAQGMFPRMVEAAAAILELRNGDPAAAEDAAASLLRALEGSLRLDPTLVREAGEYAITLGAPAAVGILRHSFAIGATLDESLPVEELVQRTPAIASALLDHAEGRSMTAQERSRLEIRILRGLAATADRVDELRERCADGLELRASGDRPSRRLLIDFLESTGPDERAWNLAWSTEERNAILVRCLLQDNRNERAGQLLTEIGFEARGAGRRTLAIDCSERLDQLGLPNPLGQALRASEHAPSVTVERIDRPRIAVVGGNEIQGQYQTRLAEWFRGRWTDGRVAFWQTGWGANWKSEIEDLDRNLGSFHAVVLLAFVRTNLGRHLRRRVNEVGIQWFPCTGHGFESLRRAIEYAVVETAPRRAGQARR